MPWSEEGLPPHAEPLRRRVVEHAVRLHRHVGPGYRESVYRKLLAHSLEHAGLRIRQERWLAVEFEGLVLSDAARCDMIVDDTIVIELKVVELTPLHRLQLLSYLKSADMPLGLLFNFNSTLLMKRGYDRVVHPRYLRARERADEGAPDHLSDP